MADDDKLLTFEAPDFLKRTAEDIEDKMMQELPDDIDRMPGGFPWDFTMPTAKLAEELLGEDMIDIIQIMFPQWSYGIWLDYLATQARVERRPATKARGKLTLRGDPGTVVPAGTMFCTTATDQTSPIVFETDEEVTIPKDGEIETNITATEAGETGNVGTDTIVLTFRALQGINYVENAEPTTGGLDVETDDELRERILLALSARELSYVGNDRDFIRWAKEVDEVGDVVVKPVIYGPGTVGLYLTDRNGDPASEQICNEVYEHIVSPSDRSKRLLATGSAELYVFPVEVMGISYECTGLQFDPDETDMDQIIADFKKLMDLEYTEAKQTGIIYYNQMRGRVTEVHGVLDFDTFLMNGSEENIEVGVEYYPRTDAVSFSK